MKRKIVSLFAALSILISLQVFAFADTSVVTEARSGVAVLATLVQLDGGSPSIEEWGSCVFIGENKENPQYLLTNYHVIADYLEMGAGNLMSITDEAGVHPLKVLLRVYFDANDYLEAYMVDYNQAQDIAVLRLASPTNKRKAMKLAIPTDEMVGNQVYTIGYPGYSDSIIADPTSTWGISDSLVNKGTIGRLVTTSGSGTQWIQLASMEWSGGNSGGPLVAEDGAVVGLVRGSYTQNEATMNMAVNIESAIAMLRNNGIDYALQTKGLHNENWMLVAAAVLAALVVLLLVLWAIRRRGNKPQTSNVQKKEPFPVEREVQKKRAFVRSLSAQHGGMRVIVSAQPVIIGRQANCAIIFQPKTPGVSSVHCSVSWDEQNNVFELIDLKSSYGTFLETGIQLTPHVPYKLRNGDRFFLGNKENTLCVEVE